MPASWFSPVDNYCERVDATFWSEPLNAATNAAFLVAAAYALVRWSRAGAKDGAVLWLVGVSAAVGIGSFLFHTVAERWALLADVVPIAVFIYSYVLVAMRRYLRLDTGVAIGITVLFAVFNMSFETLWRGVFPDLTLNGSIGYLPPAASLLAVGGLCLARQERLAGTALLSAAVIFSISLVFRSLDRTVCASLPLGTHFLWHILNAIVLGTLMVTAIAHRERSAR